MTEGFGGDVYAWKGSRLEILNNHDDGDCDGEDALHFVPGDANVDVDDDNLEVQKLAARLAPVLEASNQLFAVPAEFATIEGASSSQNLLFADKDDGLEDELESLRLSEELLRQEMELAHDFSALFGRPHPAEVEGQSEMNLAPIRIPTPPMTPSRGNHFITPSPHRESTSGSSTVSMLASPFINLSPDSAETEGFDNVLWSGDSSSRDHLSSANLPASGKYTNRDHFSFLRMRRPPQGWYLTDLTQYCGSWWNNEESSVSEANFGLTPQQLFRDLAAVDQADVDSARDRDEDRVESISLHEGPLDYKPDQLHTPRTTASTVTRRTLASSQSTVETLENQLFYGIHEYCLAMPDTKLRQIFVGLEEVYSSVSTTNEPASNSSTAGSLEEIGDLDSTNEIPNTSQASPLNEIGPELHLRFPVRTISIRIRPDVLCGAVMDGVQAALENRFGRFVQLQKRQGGHLRALVRAADTDPSHAETSVREDRTPQPHTSSGSSSCQSIPEAENYPSFLLDIQLCTHKSSNRERVLLLRVFHCAPVETIPGKHSLNFSDDIYLEEGEMDDRTESGDGCDETRNGSYSPFLLESGGTEYKLASSSHETLSSPIELTPSLYLRECCSLMQRIESPRSLRTTRLQPRRDRGSNTSPESHARSLADEVRNAVSSLLLDQYRACPSVQAGNITIPSLNGDDWKVILSSWRAIPAIWQELEDRSLTYLSLCETRFGTFPSLPTLDMQYCAQLRRLSREDMLLQLLKHASELEAYAMDAEFACANLISMLQPTFRKYGIEAPSIPKAKGINEYPLTFTPPSASCPPWGLAVAEALNEVHAFAGLALPSVVSPWSTAGDAAKVSLDLASQAVDHVFAAFQKQDDEEKSARLERKNSQVLDRLAKMQSHQLASIYTLHNSSRLSDASARAADELKARSTIREVPLIRWSIMTGSATTGTCWVTANHIVFVTQLIPMIGGSRVKSFPIAELDFDCEETPPSIINPLSITLVLRQQGQKVYDFRPSTGGLRLKRFLDVVRSAAVDRPIDSE
jgi:hypothetical protein